MRKMSFADLVREWEKLLRAADGNQEQLAASAPQREALRNQLARVKATKARQESAQATAQESTRQLKEEVEEGQMMAIQLRASIRSLVDPRNEALVAFGMAPLRTRSSRSRAANLGDFVPEMPPGSAAPEPAAPLPAGAADSPPAAATPDGGEVA